jgi:hypothetical protein
MNLRRVTRTILPSLAFAGAFEESTTTVNDEADVSVGRSQKAYELSEDWEMGL